MSEPRPPHHLSERVQLLAQLEDLGVHVVLETAVLLERVLELLQLLVVLASQLQLQQLRLALEVRHDDVLPLVVELLQLRLVRVVQRQQLRFLPPSPGPTIRWFRCSRCR